jgi:hypothetical protein
MTDLNAAAQSLIVRLAAPAQYHSVYIRNQVDPNTKQFVQALCVSVRPGFEDKVTVPTEHMGIPVVKVAWPE